MLTQNDFYIEEWDVNHPRYNEFLECLKISAPEQTGFIQGSFFQNYACHLLIAIKDDQAAGFLQFAVVPIGAEVNCPTLILDGQTLVEAKIHAFAVHPSFRNQGIGTALQKKTILKAKQLGCYQVASYSSYGRDANYHIKLSLGFAVQPEVHGSQEKGAYFLLPLVNFSLPKVEGE
jgi:GNAT superfamily N-acetyltransferase